MLKMKLIAVGLSAALAVCALGGCGSPNADKQTESSNASENSQALDPIDHENAADEEKVDDKAAETKDDVTVEEAGAKDEAATDVEIGKSAKDNSATAANGEGVEIHIPAGFIDDVTQEDLDEGVAEGEYQSATLNDDGSITFMVTPEQRDEYETMLRDSIQQGLDELKGPDGIPDVVDIETNNDYTSFIVTTSAEEVGTEEAFSILAFAMYGGLYNSFLGNEIDNVHVDFVNADTGEILESVDTKDMGETAE